jgi:hypothetical protein
MVVTANPSPPPPSPPPPPAPVPLGKVQVRCRIPLWFRVEVVKRNRRTGELVVIELIWGTRSRWSRWIAEHDAKALDAFAIGPFILAVGLE